MKEEALDRTKWRAGFGRDFGPVVRQTAKRMNYVYKEWVKVKHNYIHFIHCINTQRGCHTLKLRMSYVMDAQIAGR